MIPAASAMLSSSAMRFFTRRIAGAGQLRAVQAGHGAADRADQVVADPSGVLRTLVPVEEVEDVPEAVLQSRGDHRAQAGHGIGADERHSAELELDLPGTDVLADDGRQHVDRIRRAVGALHVGELGQRHRRARLPEHVARLWDAAEEGGGLGGARGLRHRRRRLAIAGADLTCDHEADREPAGEDPDCEEERSAATEQRLRRTAGCSALRRHVSRRGSRAAESRGTARIRSWCRRTGAPRSPARRGC